MKSSTFPQTNSRDKSDTDCREKQFNPQHVVAGTDTNWGAYKLVSLQDPSFKLELALTQNRIIIVQ